MFTRKLPEINIINNYYITINHKEKGITMSQFLDEMRTLIEQIAQGNPSDPETTAKVAALEAKMAENETSDEEVKTIVKELATKLADSTPATPV